MASDGVLNEFYDIEVGIRIEVNGKIRLGIAKSIKIRIYLEFHQTIEILQCYDVAGVV